MIISRIAILTSALMLSACASVEPSAANHRLSTQAPTFLRVTGGSLDSREAGLVGQLVQEGPCLRVSAGEESYLVVWPMGSSARVVARNLQISDQRTGAIATVGDRVSLVGGIETFEGLERVTLSAPIPADCPGPYWLAGSIRNE